MTCASSALESLATAADSPCRHVFPTPAVVRAVNTLISHQQCADAVTPFRDTLVVLCFRNRLSLYDTVSGSTLASTPECSFDVYSTSCDAVTGAVCSGGGCREHPGENLALFQLVCTAGAWSFVLVPGLTGVGRLRGGLRSQVNSVRFGVTRQQAGAPLKVLIVGSQDSRSYVYPLAAPPVRCLTEHRWPTAVNCALASPDGRFLAVAGDLEEVYVTGSATGFIAGDEADATLRLTTRERQANRPAGCQYLAWSQDSRRLAASSDTLNAVAVWAAPEAGVEAAPFMPLARFAGHPSPALALLFLPPAPGAAHVCVWAEEMEAVWAADVDHVAAQGSWARPLNAQLDGEYLAACGMQRLSLPEGPPLPGAPAHIQPMRLRVSGLALCDGGFAVAQLTQLCVFHPLRGWSPGAHSLFPAPFRAAVRTMLLAAARPLVDGSPMSLSSLPMPLLLHVITFAGARQADWLPPRAAAEEEERVDTEWLLTSDDEADEEDGWVEE